MLDKYYHTKDIYYTREKMMAYLHNALPDFEKRAFEKLLSEDPFLQDALAGLKMQTTKQNLRTFKKIEADIDIITGEKKPRIISLHARNIAVAAMLLIFLTATFLIINQLNKTEQQKIATIQAEKYTEPTQGNRITDSLLQKRSTNQTDDVASHDATQINPKNTISDISTPAERSDETKVGTAGYQREASETATQASHEEDILMDDAQEDAEMASNKTADKNDNIISTAQDGAAMPSADNPSVFITVEQMPEFPGGEEALYTFISNNLKYPAAAQEKKVEGTVYVRFMVSKKGKISDVQVMKGIGAGCDSEAERVVKKMPDWNPGMQDGKPVDVYYTLPVKFQLQ